MRPAAGCAGGAGGGCTGGAAACDNKSDTTCCSGLLIVISKGELAGAADSSSSSNLRLWRRMFLRSFASGPTSLMSCLTFTKSDGESSRSLQATPSLGRTKASGPAALVTRCRNLPPRPLTV